MELRCSRIIVTGGESGIGRAIAKRLISGGASVIVAGIGDMTDTVKEINSDRLFCMKWDITDCEHDREMLQHASKMMGGLDGLVNCAGVSTSAVTKRGYEPWDITPDEWDKVMTVNLKGTFFAMRNMVDYMMENHIRGNILNIASNAVCMDILGSYGSSKISIQKMTRAYGKKYGEHGIIINGIAPGATFTSMISRYATSEDQPYPRHAIGRFIKPNEIAELAAYLMSDYGEIICGHTVIADGGDKAATL